MKIAAALPLALSLSLSFAYHPGFCRPMPVAWRHHCNGQINGIALACQQPAIVSRSRNAGDHIAPKPAPMAKFSRTPPTAYLEQGKGLPCPDAPPWSSASMKPKKPQHSLPGTQ
jgi:hypothetical protein